LVDIRTVTIRGQFDLHVGEIPLPIVQQQIQHLEKTWMGRWLSAENTNPLPILTASAALFQKLADLPERHVFVCRLLFARAVAVEAVQIAEISDVDLGEIAGPRKFQPQEACGRGANSQKQDLLVRVGERPPNELAEVGLHTPTIEF